MKRLLYCGLLAIIIMLVLPGGSLSKEVVINLMIDFDSLDSPTPADMNMVFNSMNNLTNEIDSRNLNATIHVAGEMAAAQRLPVTELGSRRNHDLALHGNAKDEKLGSRTYSKQESLLKSAKEAIDVAHICGTTIIPITGFRPQSFSQNNDTFRILESIGILYDAGFKAGVLYMPGHNNDTWPYPIENSTLYAVPVSTSILSGERIYLSDRAAKEDKALSGSKWYDVLAERLDESVDSGDPMVVIFNNLISGSGDYLVAYRDFIDYATSKNARFVTTMELVDMAKIRDAGGKLPAPSSGSSGECAECNKSTNEAKFATGNLSIGVVIKHSGECINCNKSGANSTNTGQIQVAPEG